jgi:hypothetical protein
MEEASSLLRHGGFSEAGTLGKAPAKQVRWNKGQEQRRTDMGVYILRFMSSALHQKRPVMALTYPIKLSQGGNAAATSHAHMR